MPNGWFLTALLILTVFGAADNALPFFNLKRWPTACVLLALLAAPAFLPRMSFAQAQTAVIVSAGVIWLGWRNDTRARLSCIAAFGLSTAVIVGIRALVPVESGQIPIAVEWVWAPMAAAVALAVAEDVGAALCGAVFGMAGQAFFYHLAAPLLGRHEPLYFAGGEQTVICVLVLAGLIHVMSAAVEKRALAKV